MSRAALSNRLPPRRGGSSSREPSPAAAVSSGRKGKAPSDVVAETTGVGAWRAAVIVGACWAVVVLAIALTVLAPASRVEEPGPPRGDDGALEAAVRRAAAAGEAAATAVVERHREELRGAQQQPAVDKDLVEATARQAAAASTARDKEEVRAELGGLRAQVAQIEKSGQAAWRSELAQLESELRKLREEAVLREARVQRRLDELSASVGSEARESERVVVVKDYAGEVVASSPTRDALSGLAFLAVRLLGVTLRRVPHGPETTLLHPFVANRCWAFEGASGFITIRLREATVVTSVSLRQTASAISFYAAETPKEFEVVSADTGLSLGRFEYVQGGAELQTFVTSVENQTNATSAIELRFNSNHGGAFTCVGQVSIH